MTDGLDWLQGLVEAELRQRVRSLLGADLEDLGSDVLVKVWQAMGTMEHRSELEDAAYLRRVAANAVIDGERRAKRARQRTKPMPDVVAHRDGIREVDDLDEVDVLRRRMLPRQAHVMDERHVNGKSQQAVADDLVVSKARVAQIEKEAKARAKMGRSTR